MSIKSLKIETAGLCAKVIIENKRAFTYIKSRFSGFLSENKHDFIINLSSPPKNLIINRNIINDLESVPRRISLVKRGKWYFLVPNSDPSIDLGIIDPRKSRCLLYNLFPKEPAFLFNDFLMYCLKVFLGNSNGFIIHACGLAKNGSGYIFAGPSGSGKTTVARLSSGLDLLSDEIIFVNVSENNLCAYGMPWGRGENISAKVNSIFFLVKDKKCIFNRLKSITVVRKILTEGILGTLDSRINRNIINSVARIAELVPCYNMHFSLDSSIWERIDKLER